MSGKLIVFEGVDGAGKSTALARTADRLRQRGVPVFLPRLGKEHASRPTRLIRALTRDRRNLDLTAESELLLYCAREAQVLEELVRPALARGETVLVDRSLLTPIVLGRARGLAAERCERAAQVASGGLEPDLTLVFDVHPRTSRMRKKIERIRTPSDQEGARKGLAGSAFKERVRDLYLEVARARGYPVFHVERASRDELAARVTAVIEQGPSALCESALDAAPVWRVSEGLSFVEALGTLPPAVALFLSHGLVCARGLRARLAEQEPELAAWGVDPEDPMRAAFAERAPVQALRGLSRKPLEGQDDLRVRLLDRAPAACIAALKHLTDDASDALRERYAEREPDAVLESLVGREDPRANALRDLCWKQGEDRARAASLMHCVSDRAFERRQKLFDKDPALALGTLRGICDPRAEPWLESYARVAPRKVLAALGGRTDDAAYALRERLWETGREVIDSVRGQSDERAFVLRERALARWPSTVAHSLLGLPEDARVARLVAQVERLADGDLHVHRRLCGLRERPEWPVWARTRLRAEDDDALDD